MIYIYWKKCLTTVDFFEACEAFVGHCSMSNDYLDPSMESSPKLLWSFLTPMKLHISCLFWLNVIWCQTWLYMSSTLTFSLNLPFQKTLYFDYLLHSNKPEISEAFSSIFTSYSFKNQNYMELLEQCSIH